MIHQTGEERGEKVDLNSLSNTGVFERPQRCQDSNHRILTRHDVDQGDTNLAWLRILGAGHAHQTPDRLNQEVVSGQMRATSTTKSGNRAVHNIRPFFPQRLVVQAIALHDARAKILNDDIGAQRNVGRAFQPALGAQITHNGALIPVDAGKVCSYPECVNWRHPFPGFIARGALNLDDISTEIGQDHRGKWPGEDAGKISHFHAVECTDRDWLHFADPTTGFLSTPTPGMRHSATSPGRICTAPGVPVEIMSPGYSGITLLWKLIRKAGS